MTIAKGLNSQRRVFITGTKNTNRKQVIIFGALISSTATASAIGYALYVSNPSFQDFFLKLTSLNF
tara:strand:- start:188 stop:385 length:198 start_codon:yes stop_codon:yes gene_type:complete